MSDAHHVVVHYIRKVVGRVAVVFQNDLVIYYAVLEANFTVNHVFEFDVPRIRNFHAENM